MAFLVIAVLALLAVAGLAVLRPARAALYAAGLVVLAVLCAFGSVYRSVGAREVGIPVSFGHVGADLQPGAHFVAPWVQVTTCPLTEQQSIQNADPATGDAMYDQSVPVSGSDQGSATADVTLLYHVNAADAGTVYRLYACNMSAVRQNLVAQRVRSDVATAATGFVSVDLKSDRPQIESVALSQLRTDLAPFGLTVDTVTIGDLKLAANVQQQADAKLAAQQNAETQQVNQQAAKTQAQTAVITAQGQQQANAAQQQSLTPQVLCEQFIQALASSKVSVLNTAGPCGGTSAPSATGVVVQAPTGA